MNRVRLTRRPGQPGTKKLMRQYGQDLICVRYRYDEEQRQRIKTVEIAVDRAKWNLRAAARDAGELVYFRIAEGEDLLRRAVLLAGGRWDETSGLWRLARREASAPGCCRGSYEERGGIRVIICRSWSSALSAYRRIYRWTAGSVGR